MTFLRLLLRNLLYHWRGNFAVFLGIVLGSAVLTGALLVGDSLRGSLKALSLGQLGWVEDAMTPGRFFRAALANELDLKKRSGVLLLQGSASRKGDGEPVRAGKVTVLGVNASYWPREEMPEDVDFWNSDNREVVLNQTLADALSAKVDDTVALHLERADAAPRENILAQRKVENVIERIRVTVKRIVPDVGMARFALKPSPLPPRNAFVPIKLLQKRLDLEGRANAILARDADAVDLSKRLTLDDWSLRYRSPAERAESFVKFLDPNNDDGNIRKARWNGRLPDTLAEVAEKNKKILTKKMVVDYYESHRDYHVLESQRMLIEPMVIEAVKRIGDFRDLWNNPLVSVLPSWQLTPRLIYLADTIADSKKNEVPYSIIASDNTVIAGQPLIADDQILLMKWPGSPLDVTPGDPLTISYFVPDSANHHIKKSVTLKVHPLIEDITGFHDDPDLTPEFKGVTDKLDIADWVNPPFEFDNRRVKKADEDYWKRYRTTPRAYVSLNKAKELWKSRFGEYTSIQVRAGTKPPRDFGDALLRELQPEQGGFAFQNLREQAIRASAGSSDFGELFVGFSSFLIIAALLLVGLLVRLNLDRRASEVGLLLATGWDHTRVRRLLLAEGAVLAIVGALVGLGGALLYADWMLKLLIANWPGGETLTFLQLHVEPTSFAIGYAASLVVSLLTLFLAMRAMSKQTPRALLAGETTPSTGLADAKPGWSWWLLPIGVVGAIVVVSMAPFVPGHEAQAGAFFGSGALLLTACLAAVWNGLKRSNRASSPQPTLSRLGLRNAGRHAARSVLTVGLLASAAFLIVAVESFHKDAGHHFLERTGGSGGFAFFAEGNVPVFEDLTQKDTQEDHKIPQGTRFFPCRLQPGDDASCLSLYKPLKPRVMGVPSSLIERGGFPFASSSGSSDADKKNPWLLLQEDSDDAIPAIVDATTAEWVLKVKLGGIIEVNDGQGKRAKLRVVGLLAESIFQSEVLVSDDHFKRLYPQQTGFSFYLIDTGTTDPAKLKTLEKELGQGLDAFGLDVHTTASRLQGYVAVENMYLATFQALGGLGLILGALGLAIVLLRGVWERRAELALLLALGFRSGQLAWLVLVENALLLTLGLAAGTVSALLAVAPHLVGAGAQVLWLRIAGLLALVLAVGLVSATLAVWSTLRTPVLTALRRE